MEMKGLTVEWACTQYVPLWPELLTGTTYVKVSLGGMGLNKDVNITISSIIYSGC